MTKRLYTIALAGAAGLAGLIGCKTVRYEPADLAKILTDNQISFSDSLKFKSAHATLTERAQTLEGDEKQSADVLASEYAKVLSEFDGNVKYTLLPVAVISTPNSTENLNFTKYFEAASITGTAQELEAIVGKEIWAKLLPKARGEFESTEGNETLANLYALRVPRNAWEVVADHVPQVRELLNSERRGTEGIRSNSTGYRLIVGSTVPVSEELKGKLTFTVVPVEETKEEKKAEDADKKAE